MALLTSNSPVSLGGLKVTNPLAINNQYAGGNSPAPKAAPVSQPVAAPTPRAASSSSPTGGSTSAYVDPYAGTVFGSTAAHNQAVQDYTNLKDTTMGSIDRAVGSSAQGYNSSILDYLDARKGQQNTINSDAVQNELAREQGHQGVLDMVGNGIKSGGVILANGNSGTSSAAEALAHAYGTIGRQQESSIGNQFAQGQSKVQTEQDNLTAADGTQARHAEEDKTNTINSIVNSATTQLSSLNQAAAYASLPDRIQIDAKIAEIKQQAMAALSAYDGTLSKGISSNPGYSPDEVRAHANSLLTAGTAPEQAFNYTTEVPANLAGTGQFPSSLPIFTSPTKKQLT